MAVATGTTIIEDTTKIPITLMDNEIVAPTSIVNM